MFRLTTLKKIKKQIIPGQPIFVDTETHSLYGEICLMQFHQTGWKKPLLVEYPDMKQAQKIVQKHYTVWYNSSYDIGTLRIDQVIHMDDLFFACKSAFPLLDKHSLDMVHDHLKLRFYNPKLDKKVMQKSFTTAAAKKARKATKDQLEYAAADVLTLEAIWNNKKVQKILKKNEAYKVDIQAQNDCFTYQYNGMPVVKERWQAAVDDSEKKRDHWQSQLPGTWTWKNKAGVECAGPFNVKSPFMKQYFNSANAGEETLKKLYLQKGNEDAYRVLQTRKYRTRLQDLEKKYGGHDRIQTFFNAAGAVTGRFTSTGGDVSGFTNLQNINRDLKYIFGYPEGSDRILINADYGTAELIAGCGIFRDKRYEEEIRAGLDLHKATAVWSAKVKYEDVTKDQRQAAKAIGFGLLFGMGVDRFIDYAFTTYGVKFTREEATDLKQMYYDNHPDIFRAHKAMGHNIQQHGFTVTTAMGRIVGPNGYNDGLNIPIQGSVAEATKIGIHHFLDGRNRKLLKHGFLVNMVHDSIVGDIEKKYDKDFAAALTQSMLFGWEQVRNREIFKIKNLPMRVDVESGYEFK